MYVWRNSHAEARRDRGAQRRDVRDAPVAGGRRAGHERRRISGMVKDTSGAALPGVTVEASSPALIEKVRSSVTDGQGQYRLLEVRPGT